MPRSTAAAWSRIAEGYACRWVLVGSASIGTVTTVPANLVAGQGGQVGEQAAEAAVGAARGIALSNVIQDADYVRSYGMPLSKLAIGVADYS